MNPEARCGFGFTGGQSTGRQLVNGGQSARGWRDGGHRRRSATRAISGVPGRDHALGGEHAPGVLEQLGELVARDRFEADEQVGPAVVVRRGEEHLRLAAQQHLALAEVGDADHERVGGRAQAADALLADLQRGRPVRRPDLDAGQPRAELDDVLPRWHRRNATVPRAMDRDALRTLQEPLKQRYREDAGAALVTLTATGTLDDDITCSVQTGRALATAGLHPATGGDGLALCS